MKQFLRMIMIEQTENTLLQLFRYTFVGGFSFLADFALLYFFTEYIGLYYILSASLSFVVGLTVNYTLSKLFVFHQSSYRNKLLEFLIFALIGVVGLGLTDLFMWMFTDVNHIYYLTSKIITTIIVYLWNFFARKYILFNYKGN